MRWFTDKIRIATSVFEHGEPLGLSSPHTNPFFHLESPKEQKIGSTPSKGVIKHEATHSKPEFHDFDTHKGVVKFNIHDAFHEPLAYQLGKHLAKRANGSSIVPITVSRHIKHPDKASASPASVQHQIEDFTPAHIAYENYKEGKPGGRPNWVRHPDAPAIGLFHFAIGNPDAHGANVGYDNKGQLHAIDHGLMMDDYDSPHYKTDANGMVTGVDEFSKKYNPNRNESYVRMNLANMTHNYYGQPIPIPQHVRDAYTQSDPNEITKIFNDATNHKNYMNQIDNPPGSPGVPKKGQPPSPEDGDWDVIRAYQNTPQFKRYVNRLRAKQQKAFSNRYNTLRTHLSDPNVKTMDDLYSRLYPGT